VYRTRHGLVHESHVMVLVHRLRLPDDQNFKRLSASVPLHDRGAAISVLGGG
jgi:hypothetical protein